MCLAVLSVLPINVTLLSVNSYSQVGTYIEKMFMSEMSGNVIGKSTYFDKINKKY